MPEQTWESCPPVLQLGVLLISNGRSDAEMFRSVLEESNTRLTVARCCHDAVSALVREAFAVIVCEERLPDGSWKDVLGHIAPFPEAPRLVVIAPELRESLYGEALSMGAWDLLLRPLQREETRRILQLGCEKFAGRRRPAKATAAPPQALAATR
jgi:DNA-binding NtrC family response regulator